MSLPERQTLNLSRPFPGGQRRRPLGWIFGPGALLAGVLSLTMIFSAPAAVAGPWCDSGSDETLEQKLEKSRERALFGTDLLLRWVDTSEAQRGEVKNILIGLMENLPVRDMAREHCDNRNDFIAVFKGDGPIDSPELITMSFEAFGLQQDPEDGRWYLDPEKAERLKLIVAGVADMANVLTPTQRRELIETLQNLRSTFGRYRGFNRF